ncbi:MAG TPA: hypothetical protein DCO72_01630 [Ruminococcus sp.]|nr:hypothetical protein [Ruminococcus sp.]
MALRDNSPAVKAALKKSVSNFLTEAGGEIVSQIVDNSRNRADTRQTTNSYRYQIEEESTEQTVYIGSDLMNAVYEEFGTGEFALKGNGKKGGWWIPVGNGEGQISLKSVKRYVSKYNRQWAAYRYASGEITTGKEIRQTKKRGALVAVFTHGKKPNQPMQRAYDEKKDQIQQKMQDILKTEME